MKAICNTQIASYSHSSVHTPSGSLMQKTSKSADMRRSVADSQNLRETYRNKTQNAETGKQAWHAKSSERFIGFSDRRDNSKDTTVSRSSLRPRCPPGCLSFAFQVPTLL
eukprot:6186995-Pleurochrysis_carterae.AAC.1